MKELELITSIPEPTKRQKKELKKYAEKKLEEEEKAKLHPDYARMTPDVQKWMKWLEEYRKARRLSYNELAIESGIPIATLTTWFQGKAIPNKMGIENIKKYREKTDIRQKEWILKKIPDTFKVGERVKVIDPKCAFSKKVGIVVINEELLEGRILCINIGKNLCYITDDPTNLKKI
ncbi:MAG: helix-turn-helix transcriptional regulator [bacterium]